MTKVEAMRILRGFLVLSVAFILLAWVPKLVAGAFVVGVVVLLSWLFGSLIDVIRGEF